MLDLAHRNALSFVAHLEQEHGGPEQRIGAVLHGGSGSSLVSALFGIPVDAKWQGGLNVETASRYARFVHDNAGVSRISITSERQQLRYLNRIDHLSDTAARS